MSKPIKLYSHATGPNPWKVVIILEELGVKYETIYVDMADMHTPKYEPINPNGRAPAIEDPNTGITLWESGAIVQYLVENYDPEYKLHSQSAPDKYYENQYLMFQMSGQGPYFGQAAWFLHFHSEKLPSAQARYVNEIKRVTKVLDACLQGKEYLVGGKCSYADLSFVTWYGLVGFLDQDGTLQKELDANANWKAWMDRLMARPAVQKALAEKARVSQQAKH
ncbi:glutathione S- transferase, nitrogen catabolite repression regulator [Xylographa carneopallida]|nr:glutathione S- transferase, nitrogen catabolite repression regulator [Xylographa carneopallida]